jgi:S1-C subfamily serine protease
MHPLVARSAPLFAAALLGGGIAVGVDQAVGEGGTTVIRETRAASAAPSRFAAREEGKTIADIYSTEARGVVQILASSVNSDSPFFGSQEAQSLGSGFVIDKAGHIVTNYHVVEGADRVFVNFSGNDRVRARVVGVDPSTDIAVLQVNAQARALTPLPLGDSNAIKVGDAVVAIGNPFGLERTVTAGIVSALQRQIRAPNGFAIDEVVQTDAAINQGNSGGPLLNSNGEVIGVNAQIESETGGNVGIGFAIPINTVKEVVSQLIERGRAEHAWLGVELATIDEALAESYRLPAERGVLIQRVVAGSPAAGAGLRGGTQRVVVQGQSYVLGGDVITKADDEAVETAEELRRLITEMKPGETLELEVHRGQGQVLDVSVKLGRQPATPVD